MHFDGQNSTGRPLLLSIATRVRQISEELEYNTEQMRKKLRSDVREALSNMQRLHRESVEEQPDQFTFINFRGGIRRLLYPVLHGGSGTNTGGAHNFFLFVVATTSELMQ